MADVKISALPSGAAAGTDEVPVNQAGTTKKVTAAGIAALATANGAASTTALAAHESDTTNIHGIPDTSALVVTSDARLSDARAPTGAAGGVLAGTYPNPSFAADMATQAELDAHAALTITAHGGIVASTDPRLSDARTPTAHTHTASAITDFTSAVQTVGDARYLRTIAFQTLTDGATIAWNVANGVSAQVTLGGNRTLANPTGLTAGASYVLIVKQDATGNRTLTFGSAYKWPGGTGPTLSTAANAVDLITFISDGTNLYGVAAKAFS